MGKIGEKERRYSEIPKRPLGNTGVEATVFALGGEGVLRTFGREKEGVEVINEALDRGVNYMESARAYSGSESYYGLALKERRKDIFLASKSHSRDYGGALGHLEETLTNMETDYLDLWQVHDVRTDMCINQIFGPGGSLEAFVEAKRKGMVRFIGVTGHHDPQILKRCIELFDFDTVLMPVNPAEKAHLSFPETVLPLAKEKGMGIIGMKTLLKGLAGGVPIELLTRYALSHGITTAVIGCDNKVQVGENAENAVNFTPLSGEEMRSLEETFREHAGKLMYYKPSPN